MNRPLDSARSLLFFPGHEARKEESARRRDADAIVFDLEDAVALPQKEVARSRLPEFAAAPTSASKLVRINDPATSEGRADLQAVNRFPSLHLVVPKARPEKVRLVEHSVVALVESADGLQDASEIAAEPNVVALALGTADLCADLGLIDDGRGIELLFARSTLVLASRCAGIRPPFDGPCLELRDDARLRRETMAARNLGMRGKICIHPRQVEVVHEALSPSVAEIEWARSVINVWEASHARGDAIGSADGTFVDLPVVMRARAILTGAERSETR